MTVNDNASKRGIWILIGCATTVVAVLVDLGKLHRYHNADSLVPVLLSLYRWQFYYWEQNRFGMLVPLLASPFDHPLTNLLVQNGITAWSGILGIFLASRYLYRDHTWPLIGFASSILFFLVAPLYFQWMYLSTWTVYAPSLPLAFTALLLVIPTEGQSRPKIWKLLVALALVALAAWVNSAMAFLLVPLVGATGLFRWLSDSARPRVSYRNPHLVELVLSAFLLISGTAFAIATQKIKALAPYPTTWVQFPAAAEWPDLATMMATGFWSDIEPVEWAGTMVVSLAIACGFLLFSNYRRITLQSLALVLLTFVAVVVYAALMGVLFKGRWRYGIPGIMLLHIAVIASFVRPWASQSNPLRIRQLMYGACVLLVGAVLVAHSYPSLARVRADLDQIPAGSKTGSTAGARADALIESNATHVAGSYWDVWPAVFLANVKLAERDEKRTIWGLTHRAWPTERSWSSVPRDRIRIASFPDDPGMDGINPGDPPMQSLDWVKLYLHLPIREVHRSTTVQIFVPVDD